MAQKADSSFDREDLDIVDFRDTLKKFVEEEATYGHKYKPRNAEPSMFDILSWNDSAKEAWNYTTKNKSLLESSALSKLKYKLKKAGSNWCTESMDQFRKFAYSPNKKTAIYDLHDPNIYLKKGGKHQNEEGSINPDIISEIGESEHKKGVFVEEIPKKASENQDNFTYKNLKDLDEVRNFINGRTIENQPEFAKQLENVKSKYQAEKQRRAQTGEEQASEANEQTAQEKAEAEQKEEEEPEEQVSIDKTDYSGIKSRLLEVKVKKAKVLDPVYEKDRLDRRQQRIKKLNETTRWIPNSSFMTYFGKPPFENYGRGNVNPTVGGSIYGDYMKSHNVNPHKGERKPEYKQVYDHADFASTRFPPSHPQPPRKCKDDFRLSQNQVKELKARNPLVPEKFDTQTKDIVKPDLVNSLRFASEENTPDNSPDRSQKKKMDLSQSLKSLNKTARAIRQDNVKKIEEQVRGRKKGGSKKTPIQEEPVPAQQRPAAGRATTADPKKQTKQKDETAYLKQKMENEAQQKAKAASNANLGDSVGASKKGANGQKRPPTAPQQSSVAAAIQQQQQQTQQQHETPVKIKGADSTVKSVKFGESGPSPAKELRETAQEENINKAVQQANTHERVWKRITDDISDASKYDPMNPPKNYLFSLSEKETNPRYYKNVPPQWMSRIPYAGHKNVQSDDIKSIFSYDD